MLGVKLNIIPSYTVSVKSRINSIKNQAFVFWENARTRQYLFLITIFLMIN